MMLKRRRGRTSAEEYRSLAYNGDGYYDRTAYMAIRKYKEDKQMEDKMPEKGEIWEIDTAAGDRREVLVIATFGSYASILTLVDKTTMDNFTIVRKTDPKYTDAGRLGYVFYSYMVRYVESIPEDSLQHILENVGKALGISTADEEKSENEALRAREDEHISALSEELDRKEAELEEKKKECARLEGERDTYRDILFKAMPQAAEQLA